MEPAELISEEWSSLSGLYTAEEAHFMTQLLGGNYSVSVPEDLYGSSSFDVPLIGHESTIVSVTGINNNSYFPSKAAANSNTNIFSFSHGSSSTTDGGGTYSFGSMSMGFCLGDAKISPHSFLRNDNSSQHIDEESGLHPENNSQDNRVFDPEVEDRSCNPAKRFKSSMEVSKNSRKNGKSKLNPKSASMSNNNEEDRSACLKGRSSSSCFSEDDSNASVGLTREESSSLSPKDPAILKLNSKSRADKCPATDSQSLYARRRRQRINERLKILQNLVPNGTKVDISTMLEEAVQYVKFLQLQIKLLSSDDLWMYAPIAFNGINIGLDLNITPSKQP
ncbi:transcription factor RSL2 [Gastrolobium bilobum]|uniref:transcription factor RSL2 n=1 Tax=Gastrolobium bilobum TaxID=150636 RepID=UPI002AB211A2|nr:transcription factor RSL2 [Gastrolobium bilobum]